MVLSISNGRRVFGELLEQPESLTTKAEYESTYVTV